VIVHACNDAGTVAPRHVLYVIALKWPKKRYEGEHHAVKLEEDAAIVSLQMDGNWTPHCEK